MPKKIKWDKQVFFNIFIIIFIIITVYCYFFFHDISSVKKPSKFQMTEKTEDDTNNYHGNTKMNTINNKKEMNGKEEFLDWSMYNPPIVNGYTPEWWNRVQNPPGVIQRRLNLDSMYNPLRYSNRSQAFYEQGWYPNMNMPPQVIGCGGRRLPCLGGTQETIPIINTPVEISERNIAPVNILSRAVNPDDVSVLQQVGVLYKIFGSLNEIYPLYGVKRYRNSDTWDYSTKVGNIGNFVHLKVLTRRLNNNELQTNDEVRIDGNSSKFRVTMYDKDFPQYVPYIKG